MANPLFAAAREPVDVATGEVVLAQADLTLTGRPDLVLRRFHRSSYRAGRWFGASWASTVDQQLLVDELHLRLFTADGRIRCYPHPTGTEAVHPVTGPGDPLRRSADGHRVETPDGTLLFEPGAEPGVRRLLAIEHPGSPPATIEYTESGAPGVLRGAGGQEVRFTTADGRITGIDVLGDGITTAVVRFGYNRLGQLVQVANAGGPPMSFDYDLSDRLIGWQDRVGTWYRYAYDPGSRCVRTIGADGYFSGAYTYDDDRRATRHTDALGHTTEFRFDEAGRLTEEVDPLGGRHGYSWDQQGRLFSRTDPLGRTTLFTHDDEGLTGVIRPDGSVLSYTSGELSTQDGTVRARTVVDPLTEPIGVAAPWRAAAPDDPFANEPPDAGPVTERDAFGRPRTTKTASGGTVGLGWTVAGHRAVRQGPLGRRDVWRFDAEGQPIEHRDATGQVSRRHYGRFGLLTTEIDADGGRTTYTYDGRARLTSVTNPAGLTWRYTYDPAGRPIEEEDFDGRRISFDYNEAGQLTRLTNGLGEVTEFGYDRLGNLVEQRTAEDTATYAYDPLGRLVHAANRDSVLEIRRDALGRVLAESINGHEVRWRYGETGPRRRTPSGVDSAWRPDGLTFAGHEIRIERDAAGRERTRFVDGLRVLAQRFDAEDQLVEQLLAHGEQVLKKREFTYRIDGRLIAIDDSAAGPTRLRLDALGRITESTGPRGTLRYRYDTAGNITRAGAETRTYHRNQLFEAGGTRYTADRQGRVTERRSGDRAWTFTWDRLDRLTELTTPDGARWTYLYDALGRRFAKQRWASGTVVEETRFAWSGTEIVERLTRSGGTRSVVTLAHDRDGRLVAQSGPDAFSSIVTDADGVPTELLDDDGTLRWQASAWDAPCWDADAESGLHYHFDRYYDPEVERYLSQDPFGLRPGPNPVARHPAATRDSPSVVPHRPGSGYQHGAARSANGG
ncbi:DUF6531 domain-containing protein [Amycolatopsis sp. 195334CR]|uniref:DUF6531 domain-containing protein n=1 Tax=Amycolatopsis sp. 195334CR TaxID=2814588 RepID=UPI001A904A6A|nr:DUF6531 domain-containing protein [Amycolatopsis sp. 195334CR]MBN6038103.1 RHS repeat protein [Amycolatopsis sp. 195334CR]